MKNSRSKIISTGSSMLPLIADNAVIEIDFTPQKYRVGDIVLFHEKNCLLIHRIIAKLDEKAYLIKGDNNLSLDGKVDLKQIFGKAVAIKNGAVVVNLLSKKQQLLKYFYLLSSWWKYANASFRNKIQTLIH